MNNKVYRNYIETSGSRFSAFKPDTISSISLNEFLKQEKAVTTVTSFIKDKKSYSFYEGSNEFGFLALKKQCDVSKFSLKHKEFITKIGNIVDFHRIKGSSIVLDNLVEAFPIDEQSVGLAEFEADYIEKCQKQKVSPSSTFMKAVTIAYEANGNRLMYLEDESIVLYAHDHCRKDITPIDGQPLYTFYKVSQIETLSDFTELLLSEICV